MKTKILFIPFIIFSLIFSSCLGDLDVKPLDPNRETPDDAYAKEGAYLSGLMKIYSVYAMSGQDGEGSSDITGMDGGNTQLLRSWWNIQQIPTDEVINSWSNDGWVAGMNLMTWTSSQNEAIEGVYQRCMFIVALTNEYLLQTTEDRVRARGGNDATVTMVNGYRNEARFGRALAYYMLMDAFGRPPFITEDNYSITPSQISRAELFDWIEGELIDLTTALPLPRTSYGRADQAVAWALLSRMYLNAEVYTGTARYTDCITASNNVISAGYSLNDAYADLFKADNGINAQDEIIFPICFDGTSNRTWGGMTYLICASRSGAEVSIENDGVSAGWDGNRALPEFVQKFDFSNPNYAEDNDAASILDKRGIFYAEGRSLEVTTWGLTFASQGWAVFKYTNLDSNGNPGSDSQFPDTDFPFFRLAEMYLNYAEAVRRGGTGGSEAQAVTYVNMLRARGYEGTSGNITNAQMTLDFLLDERSRELYWEGVRRSDLIRHGKFTSSDYLWTFKGGIVNGSAVGEHMNLYPISATDLTANSSLTQNDGYN